MGTRFRILLAGLAMIWAGPVMAATPPAKPVAKAVAKSGIKSAIKDPAAPVAQPDRIMGNPNAPVTIIEYGSVACPICARFNDTVMPDLKAKYIDTGKAKYIFRPMLTGVSTIAMAGTRLAECAGNDRYYAVVDSVMRAQSEYYAMGENDMLVRPVLLRIAKSYGLDEAAYYKCVLDEKGNAVLNQKNQSYLAQGIDRTPTFVINGKAYAYKGGGIAEFDAAIAAAQ